VGVIRVIVDDQNRWVGRICHIDYLNDVMPYNGQFASQAPPRGQRSNTVIGPLGLTTLVTR
jgi:hypothetical protein